MLHETRRGAARVAACSPEGRALGITAGLPLAEARMLMGGETRGLQLAPYDPAADREALERLAEWSQRFSPLVGLEDSPTPSCLLADVTGLDRLFGSQSNLAAQVLRDFTQRGLTVRVAIADTLGAAWAMARFGKCGMQNAECRIQNPEFRNSHLLPICNLQSSIFNLQCSICNLSPLCIVPPNQHAAALQPLPIEALRLSADLVDLLHQLGIYRIGQLEALPREDLTARFGPQLLMRMDQAAGRRAEPVPAQPLPLEIEAEQSLEYSTTRREAIEMLLEHVIHQVARLLVRAGRGVVQLQCRLRCEGAEDVDLSIGLFRPTASARHLSQLVAMRLERVSLPSPVLAARARAAATAPLACLQQELFSGVPLPGSPHYLADLVDRLSSRLGRQAVVGVRLQADAQPELAYHYAPLVDALGQHPRRNPAWRAQRPDLPPRPLRLVRRPILLDTAPRPSEDPPQHFDWHHEEHRVTQAWGPERIETGWWRGRPVGRDYWRVETATGSRLWLFRRLRDEQWFLQGAFE